MQRSPRTLGEQISWAYGNLARAHAALREGVQVYGKVHNDIRYRLYSGLTSGKLSIRSIFDDERVKMKVPQACCYCGIRSDLSADHLIPRMKGGTDDSDNLVWACRSCNSSKQGKDMVAWMFSKGRFPPILLLRRYLKLVARYCERHSLMNVAMADVSSDALPFEILLLPSDFPEPAELTLWVLPTDSTFDLRTIR